MSVTSFEINTKAKPSVGRDGLGLHQKSLKDGVPSELSTTTLVDAYRKTCDAPPVQLVRRFQRRNSAVASMLFPSFKTALSDELPQQRNPSECRPVLTLTKALSPLDPSKALAKASEVMDSSSCVSGGTSPVKRPRLSEDDNELNRGAEERGSRKRRKATGTIEA